MKLLPIGIVPSFRDIVSRINDLISGLNNATNDIKLGIGAETLFSTDEIKTEINQYSYIGLMPMDADATALLLGGMAYISDVKNGTFTVTHPIGSENIEFRILVSGSSNR